MRVGPQPNNSCINSRYLLLFVFTVFWAPWEQFLLWWNWTAVPVEFITGSEPVPTPTAPWPRGNWRTQRDGLVWRVEWKGTYRGEWGCGGRGVLEGGKKERDGKHSANDLKHTNNTEDVNGTAQKKTFAPGVNGFRLGEGTESFGSSSCVFENMARL